MILHPCAVRIFDRQIEAPEVTLVLRLALLFVAGFALAGAVAAQSASTRALARSIDQVVESDLFLDAFWGIDVLDLQTGETIYQRNALKNFVPASNTKLFTTAAALSHLGPEYRYTTTLFTNGELTGSVLRGDLIIRGSGDPTIGGRFHGDTITFVHDLWADSLRRLGVTRIEGDVIGDDDVFDDVPRGVSWSWDDEPFYYAAEISGLSFNENVVDFSIRGGRTGQPASVSWEPFNTTYVQVANETITGIRESRIDEGYERSRDGNVFRLFSEVPAGGVDEEALAVSNPTLYYVHTFIEALERNGIEVSGSATDVDELSDPVDYAGGSLRQLAVYVSPPLADIAREINVESNNFAAEQVLKTLGYERGRSGERIGSAEAGIAAIRETLGRAGVDTVRVHLVDGSGLSRRNLVSPRATTELLRYIWNHPRLAVRNAYLESLPEGGKDGTLEYRFRDGAARGKVRAKTGTLGGASALSGYVTAADGRTLAFSLYSNNYTTATANIRRAQDRIVEALAEFRP